MEKYDENLKILTLKILSKLIEFPIVFENLRRIQGIGILVNELKKNEQNIKINILNLIYKLIQKYGIIYDFKAFSIITVL